MKLPSVAIVMSMLSVWGCGAAKDAGPPKGLADPGNDPELMAMVDQVKTCWDPEVDPECGAIAKLAAIVEKNDPVRNKKLYDTLINWIEEPSDWHIRYFGAYNASYKLTPADERKDAAVLARLLTALETEPVAPEGSATRAIDTPRMIVTLAAYYANADAGHEERVLAFLRDKAYRHKFARQDFIAMLAPTPGGPARLDALLAIAGDGSETMTARTGAMNHLDQASEADKPKVVAALTKLARDDQEAIVAAAAILQMPGVAGIEQIPLILEVVEQRASEDVAFAAAMAITTFATNAELRQWDVKPIAAAATAIVNNAKAGAYARAAALRALKVLKDPTFVPLAARLQMSTDEALVQQVEAVLAEG